MLPLQQSQDLLVPSLFTVYCHVHLEKNDLRNPPRSSVGTSPKMSCATLYSAHFFLKIMRRTRVRITLPSNCELPSLILRLSFIKPLPPFFHTTYSFFSYLVPIIFIYQPQLFFTSIINFLYQAHKYYTMLVHFFNHYPHSYQTISLNKF